MRRSLLHFFSVALAFTFLAACRPTHSDHSSGYLIAAIESYPLQLDPRYATDANGVRIGNLIYNSLLRADSQSRLRPELAESLRLFDDRSYVVDLRRDVKFQNGQPLTAADVKFTYESILDPNSRSPKRGNLKPLRAIEQTGAYQLRFHLFAPHSPFIEQLTLGIVPAGSPVNSAGPTQAPPGSGPFILEEAEPGEQIRLRRNPLYWEQKPSLAGLSFRIIPDALVRVLEFKKGNIDLMQNDIEPDMVPWLERNTGADVAAYPGTTFQYIGINLTHPILKHVTVRRALAYAIDRDRLVRHILKGIGTVAGGVLSPLNWAYEENVEHWPYDPERAKQLLDEAGFPDPDGDGPLPRFRLSFKTTNIDLRRRIAEAIKEQLQKVGIELDVRSYEWAAFYSDIKKGSFHLYSLAWVGILDPDILFQIFHSSSFPPAGDNRGHYSNPELDRLLEQGRAISGQQERRQIYARAQKILAQDLPYVPLWWWKNVIVKKPIVQNFTPYPDGEMISLKQTRWAAKTQ
ncbi:MAG TPA: ABC transporter substrate-binding protein [Candidatus Binatia bacterium]|nr:ABC transporter substrate-binding protein [Candidatus Binatia bacterium]